MMTRFWIMQLAGSKLLRLFPPSQNWRADATDGAAFQPTLYTIDLMRPDFTIHPHLKVCVLVSPVLQTILLHPPAVQLVMQSTGNPTVTLPWCTICAPQIEKSRSCWAYSFGYSSEYSVRLVDYRWATPVPAAPPSVVCHCDCRARGCGAAK